MQHDAEKRQIDVNADVDGEVETNGVGHAATGVPGQHAAQADDAVDDDAGFATNGE